MKLQSINLTGEHVEENTWGAPFFSVDLQILLEGMEGKVITNGIPDLPFWFSFLTISAF